MTFLSRTNIKSSIACALVGALVILGGGWLLGDFDSSKVTLAVGFIGGELTALWVAWGNRIRATS